MSLELFRTLIVPQAESILPADFDESSPVVVAHIDGSHELGEVFGKTKIKGGNRYSTYTADKMDVVFIPGKKSARLWWTMSGF